MKLSDVTDAVKIAIDDCNDDSRFLRLLFNREIDGGNGDDASVKHNTDGTLTLTVSNGGEVRTFTISVSELFLTDAS